MSILFLLPLDLSITQQPVHASKSDSHAVRESYPFQRSSSQLLPMIVFLPYWSTITLHQSKMTCFVASLCRFILSFLLAAWFWYIDVLFLFGTPFAKLVDLLVHLIRSELMSLNAWYFDSRLVWSLPKWTRYVMIILGMHIHKSCKRRTVVITRLYLL